MNTYVFGLWIKLTQTGRTLKLQSELELKWNFLPWSDCADPSIPIFHFSQYTDILHSFNQSTESDIPPFSEKSELKINTELIFFFFLSRHYKSSVWPIVLSTAGLTAAEQEHRLTSLKPSDLLLLLPATLIWPRTFSSFKWCLNQDIQIWYEVVKKKEKKKRQIWTLPTCKAKTDCIRTKHICFM